MAKKSKFFSKFPQTIFVTRNEGDSKDGDFLVWEDEGDAAEDGFANDSQTAQYDLVAQASLKIEKTVVEAD